MAEPLTVFVTRRRPDWDLLETLLVRLGEKTVGLSDLATLHALYRRTNADLAIAQTAYRHTDVHRFLNLLCARAYAAIYRRPPARFDSVRTFYFQTFPKLVRQTLHLTVLSAGLLLLGAVLGALTVLFHPEGAQMLVSGEIRDIISQGELWTDFALSNSTPSELATTIFFNNLRVTFTAFAAGITAGLGTALLALFNGLSVGALVAACFQAGVGPNILTFMAAHGPVELSLISITCGAGLHVGQAMIDPGERSRATAIKEHARTAVQLVLGCAPFMVAIGVVEGFVSPGPLFPWPFKVAIGLLSGGGLWRWLLSPSAHS